MKQVMSVLTKRNN